MTGNDHDDVEYDGGQDADASETEEVHGYAADEVSQSDRTTANDAAEEASPVDVERGAGELQTTTAVVETPVVKTASRTITPFVIAFGIYLTLFGTSLPGGAFQGGVVMAAAIVLIAMSFGFESTQAWLDERALAGLFLLGAGIFGAVAFGAIAYGGDVLELFVFPLSVENMVKLVEVAIAALVSGVIIGLFVWLAAGFENGGKKA